MTVEKADAEAVMQALSEALVWTTFDGKLGRSLNARASTGHYAIHIERKFWFLRQYRVVYGPRARCITWMSAPYKRLAKAKAICEHFHQTGQWR